MVESKPISGFDSMVKNQKLMVVIVLFPNLSPRELTRFCQLNKSCSQLLLKYVNFQVLFEAWGISLSPGELEETKISISRALQAALKFKMLKSIVKSQRIIGSKDLNNVKGTVNLLDMPTLTNMSLQEIRNLAITQM